MSDQQTTLFGSVSLADRLRRRGVNMDWYKKHPEKGILPHALQFKDITPRQWRAINHMQAKGFCVQASTLPNINFKHLDTGERFTFTIDQLLEEYDQDRKEDARMHASTKRIMANNSKRLS